MAKAEVIILHETWAQSAGKDVVTFGCLLLVVSVGILLDSGILQGLGGLCWIVWVLAKVANTKRLTIEEARAKLDSIEGRS